MLEANILAAQHNAAGEILNIGAGSPIILTDLAKIMLKLAGKENLNINYTDPRPGDIIHSFADISKAKNLLKFEPIYGQEEGLKNYFEWYQQKYNVHLLK